MDRSDDIARLNDQFRRTFIGGKVLITRGVATLSENDMAAVLGKVRSFNDFTEDNDPYGEHDFGSFVYQGEKIFWKIDYYDKTMTVGSEDPSDGGVTTRVLTVMLASEY